MLSFETYPTLRVGHVIKTDGINITMAQDITKKLEVNIKNVADHIKKLLEEEGSGVINYDSVKTETYEGLVVLYPEINFEHKIFGRINVRGSITVCPIPNHSKIWFRITRLKNGETNTKINPNEFFKWGRELAKNIIENVLLNEYRKVLKEKKVHLESIEKLFLNIEFISSDDITQEILNELKLYGIEKIKDYKAPSFKWLAESVRNDEHEWFMAETYIGKKQAYGIYSRYSGSVNFTGIASPQKISSLTREFTRKIVQIVSPLI